MLITICNGRKFINPEFIERIEFLVREEPKEYVVFIGDKDYIVNQESFDAIMEYHNGNDSIEESKDLWRMFNQRLLAIQKSLTRDYEIFSNATRKPSP